MVAFRRIGSIDSADFLDDASRRSPHAPMASNWRLAVANHRGAGQLKSGTSNGGALVREVAEPAQRYDCSRMEYSPDGEFLDLCRGIAFVKVFRVAEGSFVKSFEGHTHHVLG
jgi:hypothetical protein